MGLRHAPSAPTGPSAAGAFQQHSLPDPALLCRAVPMKRFLRVSKGGDKKDDDGQVSPTTSKKLWGSNSGIGALQQSRMRSGSHPQIRHLAMEGHVGPVTKATMEEIRRDAGSSTSNLKINSFNLLPATAPQAPERASLDVSLEVPHQRASLDSAHARAPGPSAPPHDAPVQAKPHRTSADLPPRTTSATHAAPAPVPHIDTGGAAAQRKWSSGSDPATAASPGGVGLEGRAAESAPLVAPLPTPLPSALAQSFPSLSASSGESHKRVISEKIKSLATKFSNSNLREHLENMPSVVRRRPSNTPSVSERVSQFDSQDIASTNDPRLFGVFGRFGMASGNIAAPGGMHSRSSSMAGSFVLNGSASHTSDPASASALRTTTPEPNSAPGRRPQSMVHSIGSNMSSDNVLAHGGSMRSSRSSHANSAEFLKPSSSYANEYSLDDSDEELPETVPTYRPSLKGKVTLDHQMTIAAGVQLNFSRTSSGLGSASQGAMSATSGSTGYRGVRNDVPTRRRGSLRSAFNAPEDIPYAASDPSISYRRAGSVIPTAPTAAPKPANAMAAATANLAELQRSISTTSSGPSSAPARAQSQSPPGPQSQVTDSHSVSDQVQNSAQTTLLAQPTKTASDDSAGNSDAAHTSPASIDVSQDATLFECLLNDTGLPGQPLDAVLVKATSNDAAAAAEFIRTIISKEGAGNVLPAAEYEFCIREAANLRKQLQIKRTQLTADLHAHESAKSAVETSSKTGSTSVSMFGKSKHTGSAQANEDLANTAARVQQSEADIAELSTKLQVIDAALHAHQQGALAAAIRTLVGEAARERERAQTINKQALCNMEKVRRDMDLRLEKSLESQKQLEEQVHALKAENQDAASESQFARHSASLAVERLSGELIVLREQKQAAESRAAALETRVDEALLRAQEAQSSADDARAGLDAARAEADSSRRCVDAFTDGLRALAAPLRALGNAHDSAEKLRALNVTDMTPNNTPPATPTLALKTGPTAPTLSIEAIESLPPDFCDAERASAAMALLCATVSECSGLRVEAMRVGDLHSRLQRDLATEKRLREAQGLAIMQQRDRLTQTDQRIKEATESLTAQNREAENQWNEERQRLMDNIERLTQDVAALRAESTRVVGTIEPVANPAPAAMEDALYARIEQLEAQLAKHSKNSTHAVDKETDLRDYVRKLRDANVLLASATTTAVDGDSPNSGTNNQPATTLPSTLPRLSRRRSLPAILAPQTAPATATATATAAAAVLPASSRRTAVALADAQTMTEYILTEASASASSQEGLSHMLHVYSEKLMLKEDALRNREDELECIRSFAAEIESTLHSMLPSSKPSYGSLGHSSLNTSPPMANTPWPYGTAPHHHSLKQSSTSLRNRSTSFFQGLRSSYLGSGDGAELPTPSSALAIDTNPHALVAATPRSASVSASPSISDRAGTASSAPMKLTGADGVPALVRSLIYLARLVGAEVRRLKSLICDLEEQSRNTRVELFDTQKELFGLQNYCSQRAKQEDAVQQDITHVLTQISRLRIRVAELESEKARYEVEAQQLRKKCREMDDKTAKHVLDMIVERIGKSDWAKLREIAPAPAPASDPPAGLDAPSLADATNSTAASDKPANSATKLPARFASVSSVSVSHPEAADIRAEFNELLHHVITKRDEDIERMQALADAWRADSYKASRANEARAWNTSSRGIQTM
ncbi:hypothetical protein GGI07_003546 [Coemansia sp. Benny D115]|nr:hypothetical protein GGI07_003546 [Coemansia sp. Benny D115]